MAELQVIGPTEEVAPPSRGIDGSALLPPDKEPTQNWDAELAKFDKVAAGTDGNYQHQGEFMDAPSTGGPVTKTYDEIMAESQAIIKEEALNRHEQVAPGQQLPGPPPEPELFEIEVGVEVPDMGTFPFTYADLLLDDNFLILTIHPKHKPFKFAPASDKTKQMTFVVESMGKKLTVIPLSPSVVSGTNSGLAQQLFRLKAAESI